MSIGEKFADFSKNRSRYSKQAKINLIEKSGPIHNIKEKFIKSLQLPWQNVDTKPPILKRSSQTLIL